MRLGCAFYFETEGIWADRSIAGESLTTSLDGVDVRLDLPDSPDAFSFPYAVSSTVSVPVEGSDPSNQPGEASGLPPALEDSGGSCISIRLIRAVANLDGPDSLREAHSSSQAMTEYEATESRMKNAARLAFTRLEEWIRIDKKQVWKPPPAAERDTIGSEEVLDLDRGERLGVVTFAGGHLLILPAGTEVNTDDLAQLSRLLEDDPPLWARVLADAQYYTWSAEWAAPERAVLFAALACELAVKDALRQSADGDVRALLELLLESPRDWSIAALRLYADPLHIVTGHSLKEDNRALWTRVQSLFERRNAVAHKGVRLDREEAEALVASAVQATEWLQHLLAIES